MVKGRTLAAVVEARVEDDDGSGALVAGKRSRAVRHITQPTARSPGCSSAGHVGGRGWLDGGVWKGGRGGHVRAVWRGLVWTG